jgi:hypothetical protein
MFVKLMYSVKATAWLNFLSYKLTYKLNYFFILLDWKTDGVNYIFFVLIKI